MRRIVVIGDSHAGAYKTGWPRIAARHPDLSVEVFAVPVPHFRYLRLTQDRIFGLFDRQGVAGGREAILQINGRVAVELADADLVVWAGYRTGFDIVSEMLGDSDVDGLCDTGAPRLMSAAAFEAATGAIARRFLPGPAWCGWTPPRLVLSARALAAEGRLGRGRSRGRSRDRAAQRPAAPEGALAGLDAYDDRFAAELAPHGIRLHRQPRSTIGPRGLTFDAFSRGSQRLATQRPHPAVDHVHMNGDYGAICLEELIAMLPEAAGQPALAPQPA